MVMDIRNNESVATEHVDHVSSFFVNLGSIGVPRFSWYLDYVGISGEFPNPPEFNPEFADN